MAWGRAVTQYTQLVVWRVRGRGGAPRASLCSLFFYAPGARGRRVWEKHKPIAQNTHAYLHTPHTRGLPRPTALTVNVHIPHMRVRRGAERARGRRAPRGQPRARGGTRGMLLWRTARTRTDRVDRCTCGAGGRAWWWAARLSGDAQQHELKRPQNCGTDGIPPSKTERHLHARTDAASGVTRRTSTRAVSAGRLREAHRRPARHDSSVGPSQTPISRSVLSARAALDGAR